MWARRRKYINSWMSWRGRGVAILFASSEMEEIIGMSDRVLVMHEGRIAGELNRAELTEESIMRLATGDESRAERIGA